MPSIAEITTETLPDAGATVHLACNATSVGLHGAHERGDALTVTGRHRTRSKTVLVVQGQAKDGTPTTYWLKPEHVSDLT